MHRYLNALIGAIIFVSTVLASFSAMYSVLFVLTSITIVVQFILDNPRIAVIFDIVSFGNVILALYVWVRIYRYLSFVIEEFRLFVINLRLSILNSRSAKRQKAKIRKQDLEAFSKKHNLDSISKKQDREQLTYEDERRIIEEGKEK